MTTSPVLVRQSHALSSGESTHARCPLLDSLSQLDFGTGHIFSLSSVHTTVPNMPNNTKTKSDGAGESTGEAVNEAWDVDKELEEDEYKIRMLLTISCTPRESNAS
jgi:hypothetical protein